ncbi:FKBP-type peptidyl-prolyl cis-trans isomerase [Roseibacillus persicicus]
MLHGQLRELPTPSHRRLLGPTKRAPDDGKNKAQTRRFHDWGSTTPLPEKEEPIVKSPLAPPRKKSDIGLTPPPCAPKVPPMMKSFLTAGLMVAAFSPLCLAEEVKLETDNQKVSYLIGRNIAESMKADGLELDFDILFTGMKEAAAGTESKIAEADAQAVMMKFQGEMQAKAQAQAAEQQKEAEAAAQVNIEAGKKFLAENKKREEVTETESGLQYEVLTAAEGDKPAATDTVKVHYHGTLLDGTVFDSSVDRGTPIDFPLNGVIKGWTEGVQLMPVGSKYKFYIPSDLAYGNRGSGPKIGPGETLVFEVELLEIAK